MMAGHASSLKNRYADTQKLLRKLEAYPEDAPVTEEEVRTIYEALEADLTAMINDLYPDEGNQHEPLYTWGPATSFC